MKTILYQPLFINPQAYFVFPSLYHIEKGDSFIEPANITGQLIINTLTDDPTLTPTILTVKDNNQIDFSIFAGKHIRISQYTKFTIEYTNTTGEGTIHLMIGNTSYDVISGQQQTYNISDMVKLDFLNMEEVTNFSGIIKFTNIK